MYTAEYKVVLKDFPDYSTDWSNEKTMDILYRNANILSLRFRDFSYTGGAHPITVVSFYSFDLHYNSYEIAPYAMGATELILGYDELKEIMPDNGVLAK